MCAFSLWFFFLLIFLFFFVFLNFLGVFLCYFFVTVGICAHKNTKRTQKKHKSNIKWMGIVHASVSGCEPNQYVSSWSVCESVSMCAGHIACEGVCAFSLWFFFFFEFFFWFFFLVASSLQWVCAHKNTKRTKKNTKAT